MPAKDPQKAVLIPLISCYKPCVGSFTLNICKPRATPKKVNAIPMVINKLGKLLLAFLAERSDIRQPRKTIKIMTIAI